MYNPIFICVVLFVVLAFVIYVLRSRKVPEKQHIPGSTESLWGNVGDYDVGDKVYDEGEMFDWPYYRNVGWSWWFDKHDKSKPKSCSVKGTMLDECDGTVNMGPPSMINPSPSSFVGKLFDDCMPPFVYAPPVSWIETFE